MDGALTIIGIIIVIICGVLVAQDAEKRGMNPWGWGIFVVLMCIFGLPMYLIMRKPISIPTFPSTKKCPYCAEIIQAEAIKCRHCGSDLKSTGEEPEYECLKCGATLRAEEKTCPQCGDNVEEAI